MASLRHENDRGRDGWRIRFSLEKTRKSIWLADASESEANVWKMHVEQLVLGSVPPKSTTLWLRSLTPVQRTKLARAGLLEEAVAPVKAKPICPTTLHAFIDWYISRRSVKPGTVDKWKQTRDALVRYFGADREISSITEADAEAWREWFSASGNNREGKPRKDGSKPVKRTSMSDNTVRRRTGIVKQFFNYAIKAKLISDNPFARLAAAVHGNEARQFFITQDVFEKVIAACPDDEWKAVIALSRLGGLRCPSETLRLKWEDIDFPNHRFRIHACKTEHHRDGGVRDSPLYPELRPYLEQLFEQAMQSGATSSDFVIANRRGSESYLRTGFFKILKKAGIAPWPKIFHNMRASRETELLDEYPLKDVCAWIGNSQAIAMKHYAMRREDSFARAAGISAKNGGHNGDHKAGPEEAVGGNSKKARKPEKTAFDQGKQGKKEPQAVEDGLGQKDENGRYWIRTSDLNDVNVAL